MQAYVDGDPEKWLLGDFLFDPEAGFIGQGDARRFESDEASFSELIGGFGNMGMDTGGFLEAEMNGERAIIAAVMRTMARMPHGQVAMQAFLAGLEHDNDGTEEGGGKSVSVDEEMDGIGALEIPPQNASSVQETEYRQGWPGRKEAQVGEGDTDRDAPPGRHRPKRKGATSLLSKFVAKRR